MGRIMLYSIVLVCAGCAAEPTIPSDPGFELAWEDDPELEPTAPTCTADQPDCDRLDAPDAEDLDDAAAALEGDDDANVAYALADPLSGGKYRAWPNGRIPYKFATTNGKFQLNAATRATVSQAMTNWTSLTEGRVKFRAKTASDTAYVVIGVGSPLVRPFVGYRKGQVQHMFVRQNEFLTVSKHELGHVIGLHHEQRRTDRLSFIKVITKNIIDTSLCRAQFATCPTCKRIGTYDRISVMHYRTSDLGNCRKGSVLLKLDGSAISHVWKVSTKDRNAVAVMYPAPKLALTASSGLVQSGSLQAAQGCLDVSSGLMAVGEKVESTACDVVGSQDWRTTRTGQLRVKHSLRCAAVTGDSVAGAKIEQAVCADDAAQQWQLAGMELVNGDTTKCVGVANGAVTFGGCTGDASQRLDYRSASETLEAGGACLTAAADGAVVLEACRGAANQRWFQGRGGFVSRSDIGSCLAPAGDRLALAACTDDVEQTWALRGPIRDARGGLCLAGSSLAACTGAADQSWTFWSR